MTDYDQYTRARVADGGSKQGSHGEFRRARVELDGRYGQDWEAELQLGQATRAADYLSIKELSVSYLGFQSWVIGFGREKIVTGMANVSSSRHLSLVERPLLSEGTGLGRGEGIWLQSNDKHYSVKTGFYDTSDWNDEVQNTVARVTYTPYLAKTKLIHLGLNGAYRQWKKGRYGVDTDLEVSALELRDASPSLAADRIKQLGLELAGQYKGARFQAEYAQQLIDAKDEVGSQNVQHRFMYLELSWMPFNQYRRYRRGVFRQIRGQ